MEKEILEILKLMQNDMKNMQSDMKSMDSKIDKNTLLLEELNTKVETIAEVQKSHMKENEKEHNEIIKPLAEKVDIVESALRNVSRDVKDIKDDLINVEIITSSNWKDIAKLKAIK